LKYRICVRGVLEKDGKILFIEYSDKRGIYYSLPGGSQNKGEDLILTLKREFKEETQLDVEAGDILLVREFIIEKPYTDGWEGGIHQIEIIFNCKRANNEQQEGVGTKPDLGMNCLKWIDREDFENLRIYPTKDLGKILDGRNLVYLFSQE
jgi:ADP-ribose pyrophosphatase YjhB (NUDIX family)